MPLRILLADENLAVQRLVELTLGKDGMEVIATDNGLSALDLALKRTPDLILADFNLEGLDIFSFIKKIKNYERLSDIPIILLINATQRCDPDQFQSGEVAAFFKKPIDAQELLEEVKKRTASSENFLADQDSPREKEPSDIAQYFTTSENDAKKVESLLGWSSSESSCDTVSEALEEKTIVSPSLPENSDEKDDSERDTSQSFSFDVSDEAPAVQGESSAVQEEDLSQFPFYPTESSHNNPSEVSALEESSVSVEKESSSPVLISETDGFVLSPRSLTSLDLEEEKTIISSPDSTDIAQNIDENIAEENNPAEESSGEVMAKSVPSSLLPTAEKSSSSPKKQPDSAQAMDQTLSVDRLLDDEAIKKNIQESIEKVVWEVLPELMRSALSKEMMTPIVEKVVWEVIVPLAESEIKKEIRRLQAEES